MSSSRSRSYRRRSRSSNGRTDDRWLLLPVAAAVVGILCGAVRATDAVAAGWPTPATLFQAPGSTASRSLLPLRLPDLAGLSQPLRRQPKEVTIVNFWATWCIPCLKELPELVKIAHEWQGRGVNVVGIAVGSGDPADIRIFADRHGMDYRLLVATQGWTAEHFGVFGIPVTIVADRSGRIRQRLIGPQTAATVVAAVRPYL